VDFATLAAAPGRTRPAVRAAAGIAAALATALVCAALASPASPAACPFCGKNLIRNPGAEAGKGQNEPGEVGAVPGWTNTAGQFGAAAYSGFGTGWFSTASKGPKNKGKNYFFGGTTTEATSAKASIGTQKIALPAAAAGHRATLSGWLGNYSSNRSQVRAEFVDSSGKVLAAIRIGPDTTIGGTDMALRTRSGTVPKGTKGVDVVVTFTDHANYNLAGADNLSLVIS
jgi:hypothetical protein